jgi:hypothetical protein
LVVFGVLEVVFGDRDSCWAPCRGTLTNSGERGEVPFFSACFLWGQIDAAFRPFLIWAVKVCRSLALSAIYIFGPFMAIHVFLTVNDILAEGAVQT